MTEKEKIEYDRVPTIDEEEKEKIEVPSKYGHGVRHIQTILFFLCTCVLFIARGHLSVTIVAMTLDPKHYDSINNLANTTDLSINVSKKTNTSVMYSVNDLHITENASDLVEEKVNRSSYLALDKIEYDEKNASLKTKDSDDSIWNVNKKYDWPKPIQEMILSSFFLGYCITMLPMGVVAQRFGGILTFQIALFINSIVSILTPWLAAWGGWKAVCACRIVQGFSQAGCYPGIQTLIARWAPKSERGTLSSFVFAGTVLGTIIGFLISGLLAESRWGWPSTYWATGGACFVIGIVLTIFGKSSPSEHKSVTKEEKDFIMGSEIHDFVKNRNTPWKLILTSKPVWASLVTHVGSGTAFIFFFTQVPSYIHYILGVNVKKSGLLSSLPYVVSFFSLMIFGLASDFCVNRKWVSLKNSRRICNSISQVGISMCLLGASFTNNLTLVIIWLVLGMSCHKAMFIGFVVNQVDLAPNYSGTLMSLGNTFANIFVLLIPVVLSNIITDVHNKYQWRITICLVAAFAFLANAVFVLFMSADKQPWNDYVKVVKDTTTKETRPENKESA